jgi:hypothetical protein
MINGTFDGVVHLNVLNKVTIINKPFLYKIFYKLSVDILCILYNLVDKHCLVQVERNVEFSSKVKVVTIKGEFNSKSSATLLPVFDRIVIQFIFDSVITQPVFDRAISSPVFDRIVIQFVFDRIVIQFVFDRIVNQFVFDRVVNQFVFDRIVIQFIFDRVALFLVFD